MNGIERLIKLINNLVTEGFEYFGKYYGSYRGIVSDNEDPEGLQRLRIKVPEIYGNKIFTSWVLPRANFSGKGYGAQAIPQQGDLISITFEYGNPRRPRWDYGYFGKIGKDKKEHEITDSSLRDPKKFWFKTPGGLLILLDDSSDTPEEKNISLVHPSGISFRINGKSIDMVLGDTNTINLGALDKAAEAALLGETHLKHQKDLNTACSNIQVLTAFGPSSYPINSVDFKTNAEYLDLGLSDKVKLD